MPAKKEPAARIRPYEGDSDKARKIAEKTGLDLITVMSLAMSAGLNAMVENGYTFPVPLVLRVVEKGEQAAPVNPAPNGETEEKEKEKDGKKKRAA